MAAAYVTLQTVKKSNDAAAFHSCGTSGAVVSGTGTPGKPHNQTGKPTLFAAEHVVRN
ncbi:MAG: hypothetical protein ISQ06_06900 [Planctomycetaceae bacterium]|nr:hypothetical protein [Planctomycetaceae bacterium]